MAIARERWERKKTNKDNGQMDMDDWEISGMHGRERELDV
jgi:hypothetical protein